MPRTSFLLTLAGIAAVSTPATAHYVTRCEAIACMTDVGELARIARQPHDTCAVRALARLVDLTAPRLAVSEAMCATGDVS